jgi:3-methyladenine DNA glycosylase AlkD
MPTARSDRTKTESCTSILAELESLANPANVAGMARYAINVDRTFGVPIPVLRRMAKEIGTNHTLAGELWASGIHEARLLACLVDDPRAVTESQMERWVKAFDSWDVCDGVCSNLFDRTVYAYRKAFAWSARRDEFVKRAGFVLMAALAVHDKTARDADFERFFPVIVRESTDDRNFVKKAVNWALRNIGKRNRALNRKAIAVAERIGKFDSRAARWVASDALRELTSEKVRARLS